MTAGGLKGLQSLRSMEQSQKKTRDLNRLVQSEP